MKNKLLTDAYYALEKAVEERNSKGITYALHNFLDAYGTRSDLARAVGRDISTINTWFRGKFTGRPKQLSDLRRIIEGGVEPPSSELDNPSRSMVQAFTKLENPTIEFLQLMIRVRKAAGFDLSVELYEKIVKEFEQQKS